MTKMYYVKSEDMVGVGNKNFKIIFKKLMDIRFRIV